MANRRPERGPARRPVSIVAGVGFLVLAALAIYLVSRGTGPRSATANIPRTDAEGAARDPRSGAAAVRTTTSRSPEAATSRSPDAGVRVAHEGPITSEDLVGLTVAEQAAILGDTDLSDGLDMPPPLPPPSDQPPTPRPERPPTNPQFVLGQREAGLHLLDTTLERLEREAAQHEREGDPARAQRIRVRHARITALRARRATELEELRANPAPAPETHDRTPTPGPGPGPAPGP